MSAEPEPVEAVKGPAAAPAESDERWCRAALGLVLEPASANAQEIVGRRGVQSAWADLVEGVHGAAAQTKAQIARRRVDQLLGARQWRFLIPGDDEWPDSVDALAFVASLHGVGGRPLGLWVRGPLRLERTSGRAVALVGSRASSHYGSEVAGDLAAGVAQQGYAVVSGGAYGIDAAAHRGALAASGDTVCVLAGGVDQAYPAGNSGLIERIAEHGLVVSEYAPGSHPTRVRFLARNRLIAALSQGTVVVEAAARSGARNTVSWAHALGRIVMAVPGPVTSAMSVTPHRLVRDAEASLVTCDAEIVDLLAPVGAATLFDAVGPDRAIDTLEASERAVLEAIPSRGVITGEAVALETALPWPRVAAALSRLEAGGFVQRTPTGFQLARRRGSEVTAPGRPARVVQRGDTTPAACGPDDE